MKSIGYWQLLITILFIPCGFAEQPPAQEAARQPQEELTETEHSVAIEGQQIHYTASTGTMLLRDKTSNPKASLFYVAYTKSDEPDPSKRPVTFCFNGGPGSSSIWLHLGVFGPKKIVLTDEGQAKIPFEIMENPYSLLDQTDLVFIDPVSTGYSRASPGEDPKQFHGVEEDIKSIAEFIRLYTTRNSRWLSPKYLAGESYGTTRAAGLAGHLLEEHNMQLNGIILLSAVLNFQTLRDSSRGNDLPYLLYLPSYTASAWFHKKLSPEMQGKPLEKVLEEVEIFAVNDYSQALLKGRKISPEEKEEVLEKLSSYTGLNRDYISRSNLRVNIYRFCRELLRDEGRTIGRFDSRYRGVEADDVGEAFHYDPSADAIFGGFTAVFNHYVREDLKWKKDDCYNVLTSEVRPWDYGKAQNEYLNVADTLREVMTRSPKLKVFVASGYYDLATPYFATEYTLDHLGVRPELEKHLNVYYYEAGHMMYTHQPSLVKLKRDLQGFFQNTPR